MTGRNPGVEAMTLARAPLLEGCDVNVDEDANVVSPCKGGEVLRLFGMDICCCCPLELSGRRRSFRQQRRPPLPHSTRGPFDALANPPCWTSTRVRVRVGLTGRSPNPPHARTHSPRVICVPDSIA